MSEVVGASYILSGKDLFSDSNTLMFGKVINVRFIRVSGKSFTIRSDYEPVYAENGDITFKRCGQKPSISLSYDQVADDVVIKVKLVVEALYIDREVDGVQIDDAAEDPVAWADIQLGYIDQFPDWTKATKTTDIDRFYDLNENVITTDQGVLGGRSMRVQVLTCTPISNPPDMQYEFNCVIGTLDTGLRWDHTEKELVAGYGANNFPKNLSEVEAVLYQWITRRFVRPSVDHITKIDTTKNTDGTYTYTSSVRIRGYKNYADPNAGDTEYTSLELVNGLMSIEDANMLGVTCACSATLKSLSVNALRQYGVLGESAGFISIQGSEFDDAQDGLGAQLQAIKQHYQFLRWYQLRDGTFYFYHVNERDDDLFDDPYVQDKQLNKLQGIPAVYDITMSGMRIIRCPFYTIIDPMTTVIFQSRYRLIDTTSYYYQPAKGMDAFLVILSSISFSTTGDDNTMTLKCVDIPESKSPIVDTSTGIITLPGGTVQKKDGTYTSELSRKQDERNNAWAKCTMTVADSLYNKKPASWISIANMLVDLASTADWGGTKPTVYQALTDLKAWNTAGEWKEENMKNPRGYSSDNDAVDTTVLGFKIPWLYVGRTVTIRMPYKPAAAYKDDYEQKEISLNE